MGQGSTVSVSTQVLVCGRPPVPGSCHGNRLHTWWTILLQDVNGLFIAQAPIQMPGALRRDLFDHKVVGLADASFNVLVSDLARLALRRGLVCAGGPKGVWTGWDGRVTCGSDRCGRGLSSRNDAVCDHDTGPECRARRRRRL